MQDWKISESKKCKYFNGEVNIIILWGCTLSQSDFHFGKNDAEVDNVSIPIKYYIYMLRRRNTSYDQNEFVHEVHLRKFTDLRSMNKAMIYRQMGFSWGRNPRLIQRMNTWVF